MAELLPRYYRRQQEVDDARRVAKIILETGGSADEIEDSPGLANGADGHDWRRRRGLPLIGKGVQGAMSGTNPLGALIAKERGQRPR
ncbi:MAG: hypothetical protein ACR2M2_04015 [Gaiellaceae bacterium]